MIRKTILAGALALGLATSSCLGPFNAINGLANWNAEVTDHNWLNEVIFIGLIVIPVYPIAAVGDVVLFNTIQYWGGENPIADPGPFPDSFSNN